MCENLRAMAAAVHCIATSAAASHSSPPKALYAKHYFSRGLPRRTPTFRFLRRFLARRAMHRILSWQRGHARTTTPRTPTIALLPNKRTRKAQKHRNTHARSVSFFPTVPPLHSPTQTDLRTCMKPAGTRIACHHSIKEKFIIYASFIVEPRAE